MDHGVQPTDFNSYGARRGNHEVMMRGTFANVRLRNQMAPGTEGGVTRLLPEGEQMSIFDASVKYAERKTPLVILAGKEYGSGSSRDWAAKGPNLLGVRAVIAESFERIHRSNLVGMGILPLQFEEGQNVESLGLTGEEVYDFPGLTRMLKAKFADGRTLDVLATSSNGEKKTLKAKVRIDTPQEIEYYEHGGILLYVLRQLAAKLIQLRLKRRRPLPQRSGLHFSRRCPGYLSFGTPLGAFVDRRFAFVAAPSPSGAGIVSSCCGAKNRTPSLCSPSTCRRRKFVEPDLVRVPATIAITSRGRT